MQLHLLKHIEPETHHKVAERLATRAIVLKGQDILLLYTARYDDYSLPGGGVEPGESLEQALVRELTEETGAQQIKVIEYVGAFDEYRPWYKAQHDVLFMRSHCYLCEIAEELTAQSLESHEIANGMTVSWVNIFAAIAHNKALMASQSSKLGLSIQRETWLLEMIARNYLSSSDD